MLAGDLDDERLAALRERAEPLARANGVALRTYNPARERPAGRRAYVVLAVPVPALVAQAIHDAASGAIINVFAGIPAEDDRGARPRRIRRSARCCLVGTSGSVLADMRAVLARVAAGRLDTNLSVAAVAGLDGAIDGMRAVERRRLPGKIVDLSGVPRPAADADRASWDGHWRSAEAALLARFGGWHERRRSRIGWRSSPAAPRASGARSPSGSRARAASW